MRIKIMQAFFVLALIAIISSCTMSRKTGCVPEKGGRAQLKFKGFL